jgi:hypothetical protein
MIPEEFLGAFKAGHRRSSREFIDEELSFKLLKRILQDGCEESRKHLTYITKFNNEFHKNVIKKGDSTALHFTDELRRDCYARENARNRDVFSKYDVIKGDFEVMRHISQTGQLKKCS